MPEQSRSGIAAIELLDIKTQTLPDYLIREHHQALQNILAHNDFRPLNDNNGPYAVKLSIEENRLVIRMTNAAAQELNLLALSLTPYRRLIQDYFLMIESYEKARHTATREKLEAIDMGRRGIHNEGADLLQNRLRDKIDMDHDTARKLFTLICVMHKNHPRI
ncbi:MAG: UPF0262 family protein [Rhodospirillales bacterium]|nr:UPF0262 family protein [Rhodospirillales bacterium]MCB9995016.1 UPF0262 family protein [Rhodospirillales bacterium]